MGKAKKAVQKAVSWVNNKIIQPVINTVTKVLSNPKLLVAMAIAVVAPELAMTMGEGLGLSGTAATIAGNTIINTTLNGGDVKKGLTAALVPEIGGAAASYVSGELVSTGMDVVVAKTLGNVSGNVAAAIVTGQDPTTAAIGGVAASVPMMLSSSSSFSSLPRPVQQTVAAGVSASLTGKDVTGAMLAASIASADILARSIQGSPTLAAAFSDPSNGASVTLAVNAVNAGITAAITGKDSSAAIEQNLMTTSAKLLTSTAAQNLTMYTNNAKRYYDLSKSTLSQIEDTSAKQAAAYKPYNDYASTVNDKLAQLKTQEAEYADKATAYNKQYTDLVNSDEYKTTKASIDDASSKLTALQSDIKTSSAARDTAYKTYTTDKAAYDAQLAIYNNASLSIDTRNAAAAQIDTLTAKINAEVASVQTYDTQIAGKVASAKDLQTTLNTASTKMTDLVTPLNTAKTALDTLQTNYTKASADLNAYAANNKPTADAAKAAGDVYTPKIVELNNSATAAMDQLKSYNAQIKSVQEELTTQSTKFATAAVSEGLISDLDNSVSDLKTYTSDVRAKQIDVVSNAYSDMLKTVDPSAKPDFTSIKDAFVKDPSMTLDSAIEKSRDAVFNSLSTTEDKQKYDVIFNGYKKLYGGDISDADLKTVTQSQLLSSKGFGSEVSIDGYVNKATAAQMAADKAAQEGLSYESQRAIKNYVNSEEVDSFVNGIKDFNPQTLIDEAKKAEWFSTQYALAEKGAVSDASQSGNTPPPEVLQARAEIASYLRENAKPRVPGEDSHIVLEKDGTYTIYDYDHNQQYVFSSDGSPISHGIFVGSESDKNSPEVSTFVDKFFKPIESAANPNVIPRAPELKTTETVDSTKPTISSVMTDYLHAQEARDTQLWIQDQAEAAGIQDSTQVKDILAKVNSGEYNAAEASAAYRDVVTQSVLDKIAADPVLKTQYEEALADAAKAVTGVTDQSMIDRVAQNFAVDIVAGTKNYQDLSTVSATPIIVADLTKVATDQNLNTVDTKAVLDRYLSGELTYNDAKTVIQNVSVARQLGETDADLVANTPTIVDKAAQTELQAKLFADKYLQDATTQEQKDAIEVAKKDILDNIDPTLVATNYQNGAYTGARSVNVVQAPVAVTFNPATNTSTPVETATTPTGEATNEQAPSDTSTASGTSSGNGTATTETPPVQVATNGTTTGTGAGTGTAVDQGTGAGTTTGTSTGTTTGNTTDTESTTEPIDTGESLDEVIVTPPPEQPEEPTTTPTTPTTPKTPTTPSVKPTTGSGGVTTKPTTLPTGSAAAPSSVGSTSTSSDATWKAPTLFDTSLNNTYVPNQKFESLNTPQQVNLTPESPLQQAAKPESAQMQNLPNTLPISDPNQATAGYYNYGVEKSPFSFNAAPFYASSVPSISNMKAGGLAMASPLMAAGGVPHKGSHYVQGDGGGQDDLIDARLADGEYVFDADIVSALGDGSNKEGAKKLDEMRERIRQHKRSAPVNTIPPKAKSPLAYLKGTV